MEDTVLKAVGHPEMFGGHNIGQSSELLFPLGNTSLLVLTFPQQ